MFNVVNNSVCLNINTSTANWLCKHSQLALMLDVNMINRFLGQCVIISMTKFGICTYRKHDKLVWVFDVNITGLRCVTVNLPLQTGLACIVNTAMGKCLL